MSKDILSSPLDGRILYQTLLSLEAAQGRVTPARQRSQPCLNPSLPGHRCSTATELSCHLAKQQHISLFHIPLNTPSSALSDRDSDISLVTRQDRRRHCPGALLCKRLSWTSDSAAQVISRGSVLNKFKIITIKVLQK